MTISREGVFMVDFHEAISADLTQQQKNEIVERLKGAVTGVSGVIIKDAP